MADLVLSFMLFLQLPYQPSTITTSPLQVDAYHIAFVPFLGLRLLGTQWYGSAQVVGEWCDFLE